MTYEHFLERKFSQINSDFFNSFLGTQICPDFHRIFLKIIIFRIRVYLRISVSGLKKLCQWSVVGHQLS